MKKLILTCALLAAFSTAVFAQGKVALVSDTASLVVLSDTLYNPADSSLKGLPIGNTTPLPSGVTLIAALFGGATQGTMTLQTSVLLNSTTIPAGNIPQTRVTLTGIAGIASGTAIGASTPWFQVQIWDNAYASYAASAAAGSYVGQGAMFQMNPGPSIAYTLTAPPGVNSTWTEGNIVVGLVPEPTSFALVGLGAAAMLIFRRRK